MSLTFMGNGNEHIEDRVRISIFKIQVNRLQRSAQRLRPQRTLFKSPDWFLAFIKHVIQLIQNKISGIVEQIATTPKCVGIWIRQYVYSEGQYSRLTFNNDLILFQISLWIHDFASFLCVFERTMRWPMNECSNTIIFVDVKTVVKTRPVA